MEPSVPEEFPLKSNVGLWGTPEVVSGLEENLVYQEKFLHLTIPQ